MHVLEKDLYLQISDRQVSMSSQGRSDSTFAGFNRTGFIVCSYLVEVAGLSIDEALDAFAMVRTPGVRHQDFVEELYCRCLSRNHASTCYTVCAATAPVLLLLP